MRNHHAAVTRRLSDPDFQGSLVTKCLALTLGMGALLAVSLIHDAYVWMNPIEPRYFFVDGKNPPRPALALDSPIVDDTELLEWTVKAVLAPYNVDYFNYPVELNTASRRFTVKGWNTFASSYIAQGNFDELKRAPIMPCAVAARCGHPSDQLRPGCTCLSGAGSDHPDLRKRQPDIHEQSDDHGARRSHKQRRPSGWAGD